jgi:DNA polymerase I-like protein with 3'-5' exonuclease and polymerase domains
MPSIKAIEVCSILAGYRQRRKPIAFDLEGTCNWITCYSIADSKDDAVVVPIIYSNGESVWGEEDEILIWEATAALLEDHTVPKILQNFLYDGFVLAWSYGIVMQGLQDDTMVKHFELYPELEKSLGFQASIYTREPFYKAERKSTDERTQLTYCGKDSCVTFECNEVMDRLLKPQQREHYNFNLSLLVPLLYMEARGIRYDAATAKKRLEETQQTIYELQDQINQEAARSPSREALRAFYEAVYPQWNRSAGSSEGAGQGRVEGVVASGHEDQGDMDRYGMAGRQVEGATTALLPLLTAAFCQARRTEAREVEEVSWQPHLFNGKRWVRKGKRLTDPGDWPTFEEEPDPIEYRVWARPCRKLVTRNVPVEIATLGDVWRFVLDSRRAACKQALQILDSKPGQCSLDAAQRGELSTLLGIHCNTESTAKGGDAQWFLYTHCGFEPQYAFDGPRKTDRLTTDTEALLHTWMKTQDPRCKLVLTLRAALTAVETLAASSDDDGRIRTGYNLVGTNTGRLACYESPTGSGFNLQTVTKRDKDLFVADDGMELYSCDLSGADSWTVAAHAAKQGDDTMLQDLLGRLKPAKIIALMHLHGVSVNSKGREELRVLSKEVPEEGGLYPASKATTHGSNYGMRETTMAANILRQSYKKTGVPISVQPAQCKRLQGFYFTRYVGVPRWQAAVARQLKETGTLTTPFGFSRRFFGRKDDNGTLRDALAFEPQANTTWATNQMLLSLWVDPENRTSEGAFVVEPLHQVHDAAMFQGPVGQRAWIKGKVQEWFNHPLAIGGVEVLIPYEAGVGANWKHLEAL